VESLSPDARAESRGATGLFARPDAEDQLISAAVVDDALQSAIRAVIVAAMAWAERDYGDVGELEADAALAEAVRDVRRLASERGISLAA
jgi:hypothetical protein